MTDNLTKIDIRVHGKTHSFRIAIPVWKAFQAMAKANGNPLSAEAAIAQRGHNGSLVEAIEKHVGAVPIHTTRETWLMSLVEAMRPEFKKRGYPLPAKIRASIAFTSKGWRGKARGECWKPEASADSAVEIMVCLRERDPVRILNILTHELCHAAQGVLAMERGKPKLAGGHGRIWTEVSKAMDIDVNKGTHALGDPNGAWGAWAKPLLELAGPMPHSAIAEFVAKEKKQTTRMLKLEHEGCHGDEATVWRMSSKHILDLPRVACPCCGERVPNPHYEGGEDADNEGEEEEAQARYDRHDYPERRGTKPQRTPKKTVGQVDRTLKAIGKAVLARVDQPRTRKRDRVTERDWTR
jgi:hypothetical protein